MPATTIPRVAVMVLALLLCIPALAIDNAGVDRLIARYGKAALIELILEHRAGVVTLALPEGPAERYGRPNPEFVTAATLAADLDKAGLDAGSADTALAALRDQRRAQAARLARTPRQENAPLAGFDPKLRIRGERRTWTLKRLMTDAMKVKSGWPDWLNRVRRQEAAARNRAVAKVLLEMELKFGDADPRKAGRVADQSHYQAVRDCRSLPRGSRNPEYQRRNCPGILRGQRPSSILRQRLRAPFIAFRKAMRPQIDRYLEERNLSTAY